MPLTIPSSTQYSFKSGDSGTGVWAIQRVLNSFNLGYNLVEDGSYGTHTKDAVTNYQSRAGILADGVVGPGTQQQFVRSVELRLTTTIQSGIMRSLVEGESGNLIAAVNHSIPGGTDCGFVQRRVYEADYSNDAVIKQAFDSLYQVNLTASNFRTRYLKYRGYPAVVNRVDREEYAWRLAVLYHNWPYGADRLANGYELSTKTASWVPVGAKFSDGEAVKTYRDWAAFYSMGSKTHDHIGQMVKYAYDVPNYG